MKNPDILISGSQNGQIRFWNLTDRSLKNVIKAHSSSILVIKLSNYNFNELATGSTDKTIKIWNLNESKLMFQINETAQINCIEYLSRSIIIYCVQNFIKIFNIENKSSINSQKYINFLAKLELIESNLVLSGSNNSDAISIIYNISNITNFTEFANIKFCFKSLADRFTNNGQNLLSIGCSGVIRDWRISLERYDSSAQIIEIFKELELLEYPLMAVSSYNNSFNIYLFDYSKPVTNPPVKSILNAHSNEINSIVFIPKINLSFDNLTTSSISCQNYITTNSFLSSVYFNTTLINTIQIISNSTNRNQDYYSDTKVTNIDSTQILNSDSIITSLTPNLTNNIEIGSPRTTITEYFTTISEKESTSSIYLNESSIIDLNQFLSYTINLTDLINILENRTFSFDLKSTDSIPQDLLSSSKYDISDCVRKFFGMGQYEGKS